MNQENIKKVLEYLNKIEKIMNEEFWNEFNKDNTTWEFHQICLTTGFLKDLIKTMQEPNGLIKANLTYKKIKEESKQ